MNRFPVAKIAGTGFAVPKKILTNQDLEKMVDTTDEWIITRTGIKTRHIATNDIDTSDLCKEAAEKALSEAGIKAEEIDIIIIGTVSGDVAFPATACYVQKKLGAVNAAAFDVSAACSGFIYALNIANEFFVGNNARNILVIGAEILSRITNWEDRDTCVLFGDGAGAAVLQPSDGDSGILAAYIKSDGKLTHLLMNPGQYTPKEYPGHNGKMMKPFINMQGREVFKHAVRSMEEAAYKVLEQSNVRKEDIDLLITHQANIRIINVLANRMGMSSDKVYVNVDRYGNTSAASVPIALAEAREKGLLPKGSLCLMTVFGGGFTWGAVLVRF